MVINCVIQYHFSMPLNPSWYHMFKSKKRVQRIQDCKPKSIRCGFNVCVCVNIWT